MNYILISLISLIILLSILYYFNRQFNKLKTQSKDLTEKLKKESVIDYYKNIKVIVNNNPDKTAYDCYSGIEDCLVLDIPTKKLSIVSPGTETILVNNFKLNTIKKEPTTQQLSVIFTDGTVSNYTDSTKDFSFKDLMTWYTSKNTPVFIFTHSKGYSTLRRDLIKHINFERV